MLELKTVRPGHKKLNWKKWRGWEHQNCGNTGIMSLDTQVPIHTYSRELPKERNEKKKAKRSSWRLGQNKKESDIMEEEKMTKKKERNNY